MHCTICHAPTPIIQDDSTAIINPLCDECRERLSDPLVLSGVISCVSVIELAELTQVEFEARRVGLIERGRSVIDTAY